MRRSLLVLASLALLAAILAGSATASPGSAARRQIVCRGHALSCCPPLAPVCCQPTVLPCAGVTIAVTPNPASARQAVIVTGAVTALAGRPADVPVTLWQQLPGQTSFGRVATAGTDAHGAYRFSRPPGSMPTNRVLYVTALTARSPTVDLSVKAVVTLKVSGRTSGRGRLVGFAGRVTPAHAGERIRIERRTVHGWVLIGRAKLTSSSRFRLLKRFPTLGFASVRAALGADARNAASYSPTRRAKL